MLLLKLWQRKSRGRRLNIKRLILFPLLVYLIYIFIDRLMHFLIVGLSFGCYIIGLTNGGFDDEPITFIGMNK